MPSEKHPFRRAWTCERCSARGVIELTPTGTMPPEDQLREVIYAQHRKSPDSTHHCAPADIKVSPLQVNG